MTSALTHRGPDSEGYHVEAGVALGHRRLSIIDVEGGHQPLSNEDDTVWVAFNGEIFNYRELREDLEKRGHVFRTRSDTETLVHLYEEKGPDFVDELNGQFAIALWDRRRRRLLLVRDRVGIRPLFHATLADGTVLFASEIKGLLAHGGLRTEIDPVAIGQVASLWVTVPPRTPFKGIEALPPGRMLILDEGRREEKRYWKHRFPAEHEYEERSFTAWSEDVRDLLDDAVRLQLRADVPVGTYLSGGLDSSILTALAKSHHGNELKTFSVGFEDARFDEQAFQQQMVGHLRTEHVHITVSTPDIAAALADVVWFAETPLLRTAPAPLYLLARAVRRSGLKVVLTGEGADEVFAGYNIFREDKIRRFWARAPSSAWRPLLISSLYGYVQRDGKTDTFWRRFFAQRLTDVDDPYYSHRLRWQHGTHIKRLLSPELVEQMQSMEETLSELENYLEPDRSAWHPLCRAQYLETALFMSGYLLSSQGDRMMMGQSVEGRVPYLDHRVIELAARVPPKYKLRALTEKYVLKKAFADLLPPNIVDRPKQPYRAPISACFTGRESGLVGQMMSKDAMAQSGMLNVSAAGALLEKARAARTPLSERDEMGLAAVASLQLLHHLFVDRFDPARASEAA